MSVRRLLATALLVGLAVASPNADELQLTSRAFGRHVTGEDGSTVDLRPDCRSSLLAWMREGKVAAERGFVPA